MTLNPNPARFQVTTLDPLDPPEAVRRKKSDGRLHYNMPKRQQLSEVSRVKYHVPGMIQDPIKIAPDQAIGDVVKLVRMRMKTASKN